MPWRRITARTPSRMSLTMTPARSSSMSLPSCSPFRGAKHTPALRRMQLSPWTGSVHDRRQVGAGRLVVQPGGHQRHELDDPEAVLQAPAEQLPVADRHEDPRPAEARGGADERLHVVDGLPDAVGEERQPGRVAGDPPVVLDD